MICKVKGKIYIYVNYPPLIPRKTYKGLLEVTNTNTIRYLIKIC